ncbi:hypothetical protein DN824_22085 [Stutzerimonas nosocomialis]|uniref:hypothetical protein n=1 Tax=Stutzerimonas nosocomialis TaxID=1056496 RepID=UPI001109860E|nr:hypothetical protein [Stutzerimonas nosocomialis]TLX52749.1 hypothetical protein DN824_22085 [Stutzerimonas nosocomialis]
MKAPLRFALGWVLYIALFYASWPVVAFAGELYAMFPIETIVALVAALIAYIALFYVALRRFWSWLDKPRADAPITTCEVQTCSR